ncbi:hypothetical protein [Novipirellula herctigrandis]
MDGAKEPASGLRFDNQKDLLDPYGCGVVMAKGYDAMLLVAVVMIPPLR